jgi:cell division protein FtsL
MKRFAPLFWLLLIFLAGGTLMKISYEVDAKQRELARLQTQITDDTESIRVLRAEWAYLNQPQRLEKLAAKYLTLAPMQISQVQAKLPDAQKPQPEQVAANDTPTAITAPLPLDGIIKVASH